MSNEQTAETAVSHSPTTDKDLVEPTNALPEVRAADLPDSWREAMARAGWSELMPVQAKTMPYIMAGRDLMVQARTGSGKTGAFVMPILERVNPLQPTCQALILVPTRELAQQVAKEAVMLAGDTGVNAVAVYGGSSYKVQLDAFRAGAHLVVGTPGRILDHLLRRTLSLDDLKILVFDEADRLLSMGFYPDMRQLQTYLPQRRVDSFMFSATFPPTVQSLARQFLHEPDFLSLSSDNIYVVETEHVYYTVPALDKDRALVRLIEVENPDSAFIFCNTKVRVNYVTTVLRRFGYDADELSSDLEQGARERVMARVRQGTLRLLVTTDVAARGIDVPQLSHAIQYEVPEDPELYIHRAGRTGRAGAAGVAITLVGDFSEQVRLKRIRDKYGVAMVERPLPTDEDVTNLVAERLTARLESELRQRDSVQKERLQRFLPLAKTLGESLEGQSLIAMLLDDIYQQTLTAAATPVETAVTSAPQEPRSQRPPRDRRRPRRK
jgi:ATP-dependent RNA helicase DeaD